MLKYPILVFLLFLMLISHFGTVKADGSLNEQLVEPCQIDVSYPHDSCLVIIPNWWDWG